VIADGARSERAKLYDDYKAYCETSDRQYVTRNNFYKSMRVKGYRECKSMNGRFFEKVALKSAVKGQILEKENTLQEQDEELPFH
jgi:phage/plasmid-associated DNA primase